MTLIRGVDTPVTVWHQDQTYQRDVDPFVGDVTGIPEVSVDFMAPASGRVLAIWGGQVRDSAGTNQVNLTVNFRLRNGEMAAFGGGWFGSSPPETQFMQGSQMLIRDGFEPGREYTAFLRIFIDNDAGPRTNTADVATREIIVVPLP